MITRRLLFKIVEMIAGFFTCKHKEFPGPVDAFWLGIDF